jgi:uncharacterized protein with FMN-binding domain
MRRAIVVAAGTVIGLIALLDYKSSGAIGASKVIVGGGQPVSVGSATTATTVPSPTSSTRSSTSSAPGSSPRRSGGHATTTTSPTTSPPTTARGPASFTGADVEYVYGNIDVRITVADDRITAISTPVQTANDPRSAQINSQAIPILTKEALAAQGMHFDVVSGATFTSDAFAKSLESALGQAGQ